MSSTPSEGKRKERFSSGNNSVDSPEDKRSRSSFGSLAASPQIESDEDEVLVALSMTQALSDQLGQIMTKLNQLDTITNKLCTIEAKMVTLEDSVGSISSKQKSMESDLKDLSQSVEFVAGSYDKLENVAKSNSNEIKVLQQQLLYQNCYSRRENLKFFGIIEEEEENPEVKVRNFLTELLQLEDAGEIRFQRIHRLGPKRRGRDRPIIARFAYYPDRDKVFRQALFKLRDKPFKVFEDFPKEIIERRRNLLPLLKKAKAEGKRAGFSKSQPDRLLIDGEFV